MTYWWAIAVTLTCVQFLIARWRDLAGPVISTYCVAILLEGMSLQPVEWGVLAFGLAGIVLSWWLGSARHIFRPVLNGMCLLVGVLAMSLPTLMGMLSVDVPFQTRLEFAAILCAFTASVAFVLSLERARPLHVQLRGRRTIQITTNQQEPVESP